MKVEPEFDANIEVETGVDSRGKKLTFRDINHYVSPFKRRMRSETIPVPTLK